MGRHFKPWAVTHRFPSHFLWFSYGFAPIFHGVQNTFHFVCDLLHVAMLTFHFAWDFLNVSMFTTSSCQPQGI